MDDLKKLLESAYRIGGTVGLIALLSFIILWASVNDKHVADNLTQIFELLARLGGQGGLVIVLLFFTLWGTLSEIRKDLKGLKEDHADLLVSIEDVKNDIEKEIKNTKSCVMQIMYEFNMITDRRRRDVPVKEDRRKRHGAVSSDVEE
jgi:hypothetical protein